MIWCYDDVSWYDIRMYYDDVIMCDDTIYYDDMKR